MSEGGILLHRLAPMRPATTVHLRHVAAVRHGWLGTRLDAVRHLATRHAACRRGRDIRAARGRVDRRVRTFAGGHHVARQPNPATGKSTMGKMQLGVLAVVQFAVMLAEGFLDKALVLRFIAVFMVTSLTAMTAVLPAFFMLHSATLGAVTSATSPAAMGVAFALHFLAAALATFFMQHRTTMAAVFAPFVLHLSAVATMFPMDQVLVFRPVHVFHFPVVFEAAVRRVNRRTVVVMVGYHAVRVVNGVAAVGVVVNNPAVRLMLDVHDMVTMGVHLVMEMRLAALGVVVHDLFVFGRHIRMPVMMPRWRGAVKPELAMLRTELVIEEIAFDVLDCHGRGSYRLPMSGYLR